MAGGTLVRSGEGDGGSVSRRVIVVVFFFQAEDGIRDYKVTGVQTCALPISQRRARRAGARRPGACRAEARTHLQSRARRASRDAGRGRTDGRRAGAWLLRDRKSVV